MSRIPVICDSPVYGTQVVCDSPISLTPGTFLPVNLSRFAGVPDTGNLRFPGIRDTGNWQFPDNPDTRMSKLLVSWTPGIAIPGILDISNFAILSVQDTGNLEHFAGDNLHGG